MKIQINSEGRSFALSIPTGLLFSKPMVWMGLKFLKKSSVYAAKYVPENAEGKTERFLSSIPEEAAYAICAEVKRLKKRHGPLELVDVQSSGGEQVKIIL